MAVADKHLFILNINYDRRNPNAQRAQPRRRFGEDELCGHGMLACPDGIQAGLCEQPVLVPHSFHGKVKYGDLNPKRRQIKRRCEGRCKNANDYRAFYLAAAGYNEYLQFGIPR